MKNYREYWKVKFNATRIVGILPKVSLYLTNPIWDAPILTRLKWGKLWRYNIWTHPSRDRNKYIHSLIVYNDGGIHILWSLHAHWIKLWPILLSLNIIKIGRGLTNTKKQFCSRKFQYLNLIQFYQWKILVASYESRLHSIVWLVHMVTLNVTKQLKWENIFRNLNFLMH